MQIATSSVPSPNQPQPQQTVAPVPTAEEGDAPLDTAGAAEAGKFAKQIEKFANFAKGSANAQAVHARLAEAFAAKQAAGDGEHINVGQIVSGKAPLPSDVAATEDAASTDAEDGATPAETTGPVLTDATEGSDDAALALVQAAVEAAVTQPDV